jgi:sugar transferase (PEP-CTERM system associated)
MGISSLVVGRSLPRALGGLTVRGLGLPRKALTAGVVAADGLIVALAFLGATAIRMPESANIDFVPRQLAVVVTLMVAGLAYHGAYEFQRVRNGQEVLTRLVFGAAVGLGLVVISSYVLPELAVGRGIFALHALVAVPLLLVWRRFLFRTLKELALRPRTVILGEPHVARKIAAALSSAGFGGAEVIGILAPPGTADGAAAQDGAGAAPLLGGYDALAGVVAREDVAQAIVVAGPHDESLPLADVVALRRAGLELEDGSAAYEAVTGKLLVEKLTPGWLVFANAFERSVLEMAVRRVIGAGLAALGLLLLAPVLGAVALAVKLDSRGPVIYRQRRTGEGGRPFELLKFRTMREDAEAATGPVWAQERDPRVTRVGRILRSTRLDELPQLWNVLRGDMFFVGPRPERPEFVDLLRKEVPHYDQRHTVKPGITGWAQINYRYGASVEDAREKFGYDLYYIQNLSLLLDLDVVLGTIRVMVGATNRS